MEKNKKRAERRKAEAKKLRKALDVAKTIFRYPKNSPQLEKWQMEWARRHANNLKACSCWLCCSPRENGELTMQEKKVNQRERYCEEVD
jgi:hypothetical protein